MADDKRRNPQLSFSLCADHEIHSLTISQGATYRSMEAATLIFYFVKFAPRMTGPFGQILTRRGRPKLPKDNEEKE